MADSPWTEQLFDIFRVFVDVIYIWFKKIAKIYKIVICVKVYKRLSVVLMTFYDAVPLRLNN